MLALSFVRCKCFIILHSFEREAIVIPCSTNKHMFILVVALFLVEFIITEFKYSAHCCFFHLKKCPNPINI